MELIYKPLGLFIHEVDVRNDDLAITKLMGVNLNKEMMPSVANVVGTDLSKYKIVKKNQFACKLMSVGRDACLPIALKTDDEPVIISSAYYAFEVNNTSEILPEYLFLCFLRPIFDKELWFKTGGDVRGGITWDDFCDTKIPYVNVETQRKIVHDYKVITDRIELLKKINENLEKQAYNIYDSEVKDSTIYCKIEDIGTFVRGKNITSEEMVAGEYDVISAGINPSGCHNEYNVKGPSITISGSGVNAGFFSIHSENIWAADCSYCNNTNYLFFLFCSLQRVKDKIEILKDGHSAQPHVYPKDVNIIEIPSLEVSHINKLESILQKIYTAIFANCNEIRKLELLETSVVSKLSINKEEA